MVGEQSAPVMATVAGEGKRNVPPMRVNSRAAAESGF